MRACARVCVRVLNINIFTTDLLPLGAFYGVSNSY